MFADNENMVKIIIENKPDMIEERNNEEQTPIFVAVDNGESSETLMNTCANLVQKNYMEKMSLYL